MAGDISKNTIIVLVILTVVISALGTWTVLNEVTRVKTAGGGAVSGPSQPDVIGQGKVSIEITGPPKVKTTGQVALEII